MTRVLHRHRADEATIPCATTGERPTPAERWATQHRMNDAVDILGAGDTVVTYDPEHPYIGVLGTVTSTNSDGVTVKFADDDIRTLPAAELVLTGRAVAELTRPAAVSARYPAPSLELSRTARTALEAPRLNCAPGTSRVVIDELKAADRPVRDPFRYDPNRPLPSSARVRQVRVESCRVRTVDDVAELLERIEQLVGVAAR